MNNSTLFFEPVFPFWLIAMLVIPLFSFFIWKEFKRKQKFLSFRVVAQCLILISILGILLNPGFEQEKNSQGILLLTSRYNKSKVDSLLNAQRNLRVVQLSDADSYQDAELLASYNDLTDLDSDIKFVLGDGLPFHVLEMMSSKNFEFISGQLPVGITQLHIPENIKANQQATIQGALNASGKTTLTLIGPGGAEDSITINKKGHLPFSLNFKPKQSGSFIYSIVSKNEEGIQTEQLPVEVLEEQKLNILFLQKFPSFEVRQLKNFLAEKGHHIALRYQISKSNYRFELANLSTIRIAQITASILQSFDLVILDSDALNALTSAEKNTLEESVHNGLGMILLMNQVAEKDKLRERFVPIGVKRSLKDTIQLNLTAKQYTLPLLPIQISESPSVYIVTKNKNRVLAAYCYNGIGKTGVQFLQETYRIALEGNIDGYAALWSPLLEKTARTKNEKFKIRLKNSFPFYPDEPLYTEIISTTEDHPTFTNDRITLPLIEHVIIDNTWYGKSWAGQPGWHAFSADSSILHYFISEPLSWNSLRITNQHTVNKSISVASLKNSGFETTIERKRVASMIFYLIFLFASAFLWLAPKI
jgi:hypothetical protein